MQKINNSSQMSILVTGANRGLGKDLAHLLLKNNPTAKLLFTTRKSTQQLDSLINEWHKNYPQTQISFKNLDLGSSESINKFVDDIKKQNIKFNVIVNNAALGADHGDKVPDVKWAKDTFYANVIGTMKFTESLIPFLANNGRVVNVSSKMGALQYQSKPVQQQFNDPTLQQQQIFTAVEQYIALCQSGDLGKWWKSAYGTSKMLLNAWSRFILKRKLNSNQVSIAMSPGHCKTDMGGNNAPNSSESGAKAIYDCIFMENPSYEVFYHTRNKSDYFTCG